MSPEDRERVIQWLLAQKFDVPAGRRGGTTPEEWAYRRRAVDEITLVQATMGLRISECLKLSCGDVHAMERGRAWVRIWSRKSKTHIGRDVSTFDARHGREVAARLLARVEGHDARDPVFGQCKDPAKRWDKSNAKDPFRKLYDQMADELGIDVLKIVSTHVWRASLNTEYKALTKQGLIRMDDEERSALFGHTEAVNERSYTVEADFGPERQVATVMGFEPRVYDGGRRRAM